MISIRFDLLRNSGYITIRSLLSWRVYNGRIIKKTDSRRVQDQEQVIQCVIGRIGTDITPCFIIQINFYGLLQMIFDRIPFTWSDIFRISRTIRGRFVTIYKREQIVTFVTSPKPVDIIGDLLLIRRDTPRIAVMPGRMKRSPFESVSMCLLLTYESSLISVYLSVLRSCILISPTLQRSRPYRPIREHPRNTHAARILCLRYCPIHSLMADSIRPRQTGRSDF